MREFLTDPDTRMNATVHWKAFFANTFGLIAAAAVAFGPDVVIRVYNDTNVAIDYLKEETLWLIALVYAIQFLIFSWFQGYKTLDSYMFGGLSLVGDFILRALTDAARLAGATKYELMRSNPRQVRHIFYDFVNEMPATRSHAFSIWGRYYSLVSCWAIVISWFITTCLAAILIDQIDGILVVVLVFELFLFWVINDSIDSLMYGPILQLPKQQIQKILADHRDKLRDRVNLDFKIEGENGKSNNQAHCG